MISKSGRKIVAFLLLVLLLFQNTSIVDANVSISAPSAILIESSTGQVIYEVNATERRSPASITKIMTLLLTFEKLSEGKISLEDEVITSAYAKSMGGSQVYLEEGEMQTLDTMIKCISIASGNDASVAVAEYIAGSEEAFVDMMNVKAQDLGMVDTHFEDCCGLTNSDDHYTTAKDVAIMSRELTLKYPEVFLYAQIWMEDITHVTARGTSQFTLSSTNKLLKQYEWATGLKTGSTNKAKYCLSATASKDNIDLIAVVMGAPDYKVRFQDAASLLNYGFSVSDVFVDENKDVLEKLYVEGGKSEWVPLHYESEYRYLDIKGNDLSQVQKVINLPQTAKAPVEKGGLAGEAQYLLNGAVIGSIPILYAETVEKAVYKDYLLKMFSFFLL
ncbi:MAG TPA: D-alanyl-D-alanine carboxypeptidase family protein [Lachnospiraceae bacterium]|nr:D-alanyl-D-alanine carboxypeptidase family protein [Lachnospiraceae bacterium]